MPRKKASPVVNLSCNANNNDGAYFSFTGQNQVMVTMNSNWDGVTSFDGLDRAANTFVQTYMQTGGDVGKAVEAANKALQTTEQGPDVGDYLESKKMN